MEKNFNRYIKEMLNQLTQDLDKIKDTDYMFLTSLDESGKNSTFQVIYKEKKDFYNDRFEKLEEFLGEFYDVSNDLCDFELYDKLIDGIIEFAKFYKNDKSIYTEITNNDDLLEVFKYALNEKNKLKNS